FQLRYSAGNAGTFPRDSFLFVGCILHWSFPSSVSDLLGLTPYSPLPVMKICWNWRRVTYCPLRFCCSFIIAISAALFCFIRASSGPASACTSCCANCSISASVMFGKILVYCRKQSRPDDLANLRFGFIFRFAKHTRQLSFQSAQ